MNNNNQHNSAGQNGNTPSNGTDKNSFVLKVFIVALSIIAVMLTTTFSAMMLDNFFTPKEEVANTQKKAATPQNTTTETIVENNYETPTENTTKKVYKPEDNQNNEKIIPADNNIQKDLSMANVGDYITFGSYEQDNNYSNGNETIEWLVLEKQNNKMLVISRYALDCQQYNYICEHITWETCSLRRWLNNDFLNTAFTITEQEIIPTSTVYADQNPEYNNGQGNTTKDKVFILSIFEANRYFRSDIARQCKPTAYADSQGANANNNGNCWWWLRTIGGTQDCATIVNNNGNVRRYGNCVRTANYAIRPAMWIDLEY